jgi:hypothetical protein
MPAKSDKEIYYTTTTERDRKPTSVLQTISEAVSRSNVTEHLSGCKIEEHAKVNLRSTSRPQWSSRLQWNKVRGCGLNSAGSEYCAVAGFCEHCNCWNLYACMDGQHECFYLTMLCYHVVKCTAYWWTQHFQFILNPVLFKHSKNIQTLFLAELPFHLCSGLLYTFFVSEFPAQNYVHLPYCTAYCMFLHHYFFFFTLASRSLTPYSGPSSQY